MKALLDERFKCIAALGIQIHGAIGFTEDHDLPLCSKRAKVWWIDLPPKRIPLVKLELPVF